MLVALRVRLTLAPLAVVALQACSAPPAAGTGASSATGAGGGSATGGSGQGGSGQGGSGTTSVPAGCDDPYDARDLSTMSGLNSKWRTYSARLLANVTYFQPGMMGVADTRVTVEPDLGGLSAAAWMGMIAGFGHDPSFKPVNRLMLNLDPGSQYAPENDPNRISDADWAAYEAVIFKDRLALTADEVALIKGLQQKIDLEAFTVGQRNDLLLAFLVALETGPGGVCSPRALFDHRTPFILHQRKYVHKQPSPGSDVEAEEENQLAGEMSDFINLVKTYDSQHGTRLLRWIAGVRLGENMSPDPQQWKASVLFIAQQINKATGGFLKERELIANGPKMGSDYRVTTAGGATISIADDLASDTFIADISKETYSFGIGYKFMAEGGNIGEKMQAATCASGKLCDIDSVADWKYFLEGKGVDDLKQFVNHSYPSFPRHSNVVWVGDSGDAMATLFQGGAPTAAYQAISDKFVHAANPDTNPNFRGTLFMESNASEIDFEDPTKSHDTGKYMTYMLGSGTWPGTMTTLPLDWVPAADHSHEWETATIGMWKSWPQMP